ncbi:MAG: sugar transferase [Granulosicoccus sp.]
MNKTVYPTFKRGVDIIVSFWVLLLASPLLLIVLLFARLKMGAPVFFLQERPGKDEKPFRLIKLRTMTNETDSSGKLLPNDQRINRFGQFLRKTSIDELPGLINVLRGDMSLIGPRPLLMRYLPLYTSEYRKRHLVRPGITGLAQVNGRNKLTWESKLDLDVEYVHNLSFTVDMKILLRSFTTITSASDVDQSPEWIGMEPLDVYLKRNGGWK